MSSNHLRYTKHLFMMPDLIKKRVIIFYATTIILAIVEVVLTIICVGSISGDTGVSYFIGSAIFGFIFDVFILDIIISFACLYLKFAFKMVKLRGYWFQIPNDIYSKKTNIANIIKEELEKSSISSKI